MAYQSGALVPLAGGGYVSVSLESVMYNGAATKELDAQFYDASGHAVGGKIFVARAFSDPYTGTSGTIEGFDVAGTANGGFAVVYSSRDHNGLGRTDRVDHGLVFSARGTQTGTFGEYVGDQGSATPELVPLIGGGMAVQHDHFFWIYDAGGSRVIQGATSAGETTPVLRDLFSAVGFESKDVTTGETHLYVINPLNGAQVGAAPVATVSGTGAAEVLTGDAGPDSIVGGAGDDTLSGAGGYDVLVGGAGADRFVLRLDGSVDRLADFDSSDRLQFADLTGGAFTPGAHAVVSYDAFTGAVSWDDDGPGSGKATYIGLIEGGVKLRGFNIVGDVRPEYLKVAEGANGSTTVLFSHGDPTFDWSSTHFDAAGKVATFEIHAADGSWWKRWNEPANGETWDYTLAQYDTLNRLKVYETHAQDGTYVIWTSDPGSEQPWSRVVDNYDAQGRLLERDVLFDAGNQWQIRYDVKNAQPWDHVVDEVDANGRITATTYYNADDSVFV